VPKEESCSKFVAAYRSNYVNCYTCRYRDECLVDSIEYKRDREFAEFERMLKENKPVEGPL